MDRLGRLFADWLYGQPKCTSNNLHVEAPATVIDWKSDSSLKRKTRISCRKCGRLIYSKFEINGNVMYEYSNGTYKSVHRDYQGNISRTDSLDHEK